MQEIVVAIFTGMVTFAATNIDDLFVLMLFFSQTNAHFRRWHVVIGQYLGFSALVLLSLLGFFLRFVIPRPWLGLLGIVPLCLGIQRWRQRKQHAEETRGGRQEKIATTGVAALGSVATITFANGGDNIGIYTPLFASSDGVRLGVLLAVFYGTLAVWCGLGYRIARHPLIARTLTRYGHVLVPFVLMGLGLYIMLESGTFRLVQW
jgi:cadmium resistance transport/sequestration family protein